MATIASNVAAGLARQVFDDCVHSTMQRAAYVQDTQNRTPISLAVEAWPA